MKAKNAPALSLSWLIAIVLIILYFVGNVGVWALWVASGLIIGPLILVILLAVLAGIMVAFGQIGKKK